jgi:hypothetical protein
LTPSLQKSDKTQVFADQIEIKQAELAPWAAQVTSKKAALDLATSERDLLLKKATDFSSALASAQDTVTRIDEETKAKVIYHPPSLMEKINESSSATNLSCALYITESRIETIETRACRVPGGDQRRFNRTQGKPYTLLDSPCAPKFDSL